MLNALRMCNTVLLIHYDTTVTVIPQSLCDTTASVSIGRSRFIERSSEQKPLIPSSDGEYTLSFQKSKSK